MSISLRDQIQEDMKTAMRDKDSVRLGAIRLLFSQIKQVEIDNRVNVGNKLLDDNQIFAVIDKMIKQRLDSIEQYKKGNRDDLVQNEQGEIDVLEKYLPQQLTEAEVTKLIEDAIKETGASSIKEMSKVIAYIKPKAQGRADIGKISAKIKELLA